MRRTTRRIHFLIVCVVSLLFFSSCITRKPVPYFADFPDTASATATKTVSYKSPVIQSNDILYVSISTLDNALVSPVNTTNAINGSAQQSSGYMVNSKGEVELPFVGTVMVQGYTTTQAQDTIRALANKLFNNPIVSVRYANFKITVLGEVRSPGSFIMPNEKVTLFDALGTAGDLTDFAKSNSILLVRDSTDGNKQMVRLNINSKNILQSPYYFLKPGDMLYVEPTSDKLVNTTNSVNTRNTIGLFASSLAVLSTVIVLLTRL